ncbi:hypothetical protein ACFPM0_27580 [Pseudonocardia sulfidoxydans]
MIHTPVGVAGSDRGNAAPARGDRLGRGSSWTGAGDTSCRVTWIIAVVSA